MIDLPLGATEDMVLGSIDFEAAVKTGASCFCREFLRELTEVFYILTKLICLMTIWWIQSLMQQNPVLILWNVKE